MKRSGIPILGSPYSARGFYASASKLVNMYVENNDPRAQPKSPVTCRPLPGLRTVAEPPSPDLGRGLYRATNGELYAVVGSNLYFIDAGFSFVLIGPVSTGTGPVSMSDNRLCMVIVDGTATGGWVMDLSTRALYTINPTNFYGGTLASYIDTFFVFNNPGTNEFYKTLSNVTAGMLFDGTAFDPIDVYRKEGGNDAISGIVILSNELLAIGTLTMEHYAGVASQDNYFEQVQGSFIDWGCIAPYSIITMDGFAFMLSQNNEGLGTVIRVKGYVPERISTHAVEAEIQSYARLSDAVGYGIQFEGHTLYVLSFPDADKTWVYDLTAGAWSEWGWFDGNGSQHRHRAVKALSAYGQRVALDWQRGTLYALDSGVYQELGQSIVRKRSFPHLSASGNLMTYVDLVVDIQTGTIEDMTIDPQLTLRWSDDRGKTFPHSQIATLSKTGKYQRQVMFTKLGQSRDRVFMLEWAEDLEFVLMGIFVNVKEGPA